jgi:hypothetical protein
LAEHFHAVAAEKPEDDLGAAARNLDRVFESGLDAVAGRGPVGRFVAGLVEQIEGPAVAVVKAQPPGGGKLELAKEIVAAVLVGENYADCRAEPVDVWGDGEFDCGVVIGQAGDVAAVVDGEPFPGEAVARIRGNGEVAAASRDCAFAADWERPFLKFAFGEARPSGVVAIADPAPAVRVTGDIRVAWDSRAGPAMGQTPRLPVTTLELALAAPASVIATCMRVPMRSMPAGIWMMPQRSMS